MTKKAIASIVIIISLYLYFPVFCLVLDIDVEGNNLVTAEEIRKTSEVYKKLLAFHNKNESIEKIMSIKLIKRVSYQQVSLRRIRIVVEEKHILMEANIDNRAGHIDADSNLIFDIGQYLKGSYPILSARSESDIKEGVFLLKILISEKIFNAKEISEILIDKIMGTSIFTIDGTEIYLGNGEIKKKITNLSLIMEDGRKKKMKESYIDISNINKGIVNYNL
jgi:cell division septal protein FtsQ